MLQLAQRTVGTEFHERLDEDCRLDRHVERPGNPHPRERLLRGVFFANGHQPWHLLFGNRNFLASPLRESDVADFEVGCWR